MENKSKDLSYLQTTSPKLLQLNSASPVQQPLAGIVLPILLWIGMYFAGVHFEIPAVVRLSGLNQSAAENAQRQNFFSAINKFVEHKN